MDAYADPDPRFYLNADPDTDQGLNSGFWFLIQGFFDKKLKNFTNFTKFLASMRLEVCTVSKSHTCHMVNFQQKFKMFKLVNAQILPFENGLIPQGDSLFKPIYKTREVFIFG